MVTVYDEKTTTHDICIMPCFWEDEIQNEEKICIFKEEIIMRIGSSTSAQGYFAGDTGSKPVSGSDAYSKNIEEQIRNAEKKLQDLSKDDKIPPDERMKKQQELLAGLKKNDRVLTTAGIYGTVANVDRAADKVSLKVDESENVRLTVTLASISKVLSDAEESSAPGA